MFKTINRKQNRRRVRYRVRKRLHGTADVPRVAIYRSLKHIYAQAIDDDSGKTLASASTCEAAVKSGAGYGGNVEAAKKVGEALGSKLKEVGVKRAIFDRGGFLYHGRIKALADAIRGAGVKF